MSKPKIVRVKFSGGFHNQDRKITLHIPENLIKLNGNRLYVDPADLTKLQRKRLHSHICGITTCMCNRYSSLDIEV